MILLRVCDSIHVLASPACRFGVTMALHIVGQHAAHSHALQRCLVLLLLLLLLPLLVVLLLLDSELLSDQSLLIPVVSMNEYTPSNDNQKPLLVETYSLLRS